MATTKVDVNLIDASGITSSKYLKGDGTWGTVDALPSQTSQSGKFLTTDGSSASWATAGGGGLAGVQVYTSGGTWTKSTRESALGVTITKLIVEVQGGGGSGNREDATDNNNSAGGGGGYAKKFLDVTNISTVTVTVGDGGPGQSNIAAGTAGGLSSFVKATGSCSFTDVIGNGGAGGSTSSLAPSEGGTATGGDINVQGGVGASQIMGHPAGGAILGNAGKSQPNSSLTDGRGYGSGGGSGRGQASGAGGPGIVIVWEYQ